MDALSEISRNAAYQTFDIEGPIASLFEPDTLLSAHYYENLRRRIPIQPEKRLMLAILQDAINCYQDNFLARGSQARRLFIEAEEWVLKKGGDWIFSFENICETLGFNPIYVRHGLLRWKEKKAASVQIPITGGKKHSQVKFGRPTGAWRTSVTLKPSAQHSSKTAEVA